LQSNDKLANKYFPRVLAGPVSCALALSCCSTFVCSFSFALSSFSFFFATDRRDPFAFVLLSLLGLTRQVSLGIRGNSGIRLKGSVFFSSNCSSELWIANNRSPSPPLASCFSFPLFALFSQERSVRFPIKISKLESCILFYLLTTLAILCPIRSTNPRRCSALLPPGNNSEKFS